MVVDVDVLDLSITHGGTGDLEIRLFNPAGDTTFLLDNLCGNDNNVALSFDDEALLTTPSCPLIGNQLVKPVTPLNKMDNTNLEGTWMLEVIDDDNGNGGSLQAWSLYICIANFSAPLPVSWLDFSARPENRQSFLEWRTAQERDNEGFEVQRRAESDRDFVTIGWVDGRNLAGENQYTFTDANVRSGQTYFYRLRQLDFDGRDDFSPIRAVRFEASDQAEIQLFPNPVTDQLQYSVFYGGGSLSYELLDGLGRHLRQASLGNVNGEIDVSTLPAGMYFIRFQAGNWQEIRRIVKE
jgi:subtilisin-like proprotein convertase family protein